MLVAGVGAASGVALGCGRRAADTSAVADEQIEMGIEPVDPPVGSAVHTLPPLPYAYDALEPAIDARTMEIHHRRHHQAYINGLLAAVEPHEALRSQPVEPLLRSWSTLPEEVQEAVRNHGGGHHNHALFWRSMAPGGRGNPAEGRLGEALTSAFGGVDPFREAFRAASMRVFGSGWAWLVQGVEGRLEVVELPNQDSPLMEGQTPLLGLDVWEHAYYLHYQWRRADYVDAWWSVVDWEAVNRRLA